MSVSRHAGWAIAALAALLPLIFAAFTGHAWEDYYITLRASRNLAEGNGLVFTAGERVHTFTSPLGVLLPAGFTWLTGPGREEAALWLYRVFNAGVLAAAALVVWRRSATLGWSPLARGTVFVLLLADAKLTDFSINGMETALLAAWVLLLWSELEAPAGPRASMLGATFAGLMWTRPDAFILAAALIAPHLLFRDGAGHARRAVWAALWRGALLGGLLYVPWFAWAWWYYGTPVPHTVVAKSVVAPPFDLWTLLQTPWHVLVGQSVLRGLFQPAYLEFGGWPPALVYLSHGLAAIAAFAWLVPAAPTYARRTSLALFFGMFYLRSITLYPWYVPPWTVIAALTLAGVVEGLNRRIRAPAVLSSLRIATTLVVAVQVAQWVAVAWQMRVHQQLTETPVRRAIGEWLRDHAQRGDTVFLEPLGYIGYFSGLKTYDFPGLSSPEVVAAMREGYANYAGIIARLRPTWVVLRPWEAAQEDLRVVPILAHYEHMRTWTSRPQLDAVEFLPGRKWLEWESTYHLYRVKPVAAPATRAHAATLNNAAR